MYILKFILWQLLNNLYLYLAYICRCCSSIHMQIGIKYGIKYILHWTRLTSVTDMISLTLFNYLITISMIELSKLSFIFEQFLALNNQLI